MLSTSMKTSAVIIEDEYKVREVFVNLIKLFCPSIEVVGEAENISKGYELIIDKKPSVVFLDIEMRGGNGFELLKKFKEIPFEVIFVTSYGHYAIKAIKLSALDYLLKPVMVEDLKVIEKRLFQKLEEKDFINQYRILQENVKATNEERKLVINTKQRLEYLNVSDINYLKADGNYTSIYLKNNVKHYIAKTLKEYEDLLCYPDSFFFRTHKTFIVNIKCIKHVEKGDTPSLVLNDGTRLEISRRKRQELFDIMNPGL